MLIRLASLLLCAATAVAAGTGYLFAAAALYVVAGVLEFFSKYDTARRALFGSVSDRWGELAVFTGYAWFTHDSPWLLAVMAAIAGSMMVSYTRARAEALGVQISSGLMQRAERIVLVAGGTLIAAWYGYGTEQATPILGGTMLLCAVGSTGTAVNRWIVGYRMLAAREAAVPRAVTPAAKKPDLARPVEQH